MNLARIRFAALMALPLAVGGCDEAGTRTLVGVAVTLVVLALVIGIGMLMDRGARA
jgi:hypothetical protein